MESQSGLQRRNPRISCRLAGGGGDRHAPVFVLVHPTSNFHHHYLIAPLAAWRRDALLLVNTRYVGNDSLLLVMERAIQDLGAAIRIVARCGLRQRRAGRQLGRRALAAFYVEQARAVTVTHTPDGRPFELLPADVPPVDRLALVCPHPGRAEQLLVKIDPAIAAETIRGARSTRSTCSPRATAAVRRLVARRVPGGAGRAARAASRTGASRASPNLDGTRSPVAADEAFVIHRTQADPRLLDLALDRNDRKRGTLQGDARGRTSPPTASRASAHCARS